jgi:hypothetical protein
MTQPYKHIGYETLAAALDAYRDLRDHILAGIEQSYSHTVCVPMIHEGTLLLLAQGHPDHKQLLENGYSHFILFDNGRRAIKNANWSFAIVGNDGTITHLSMHGCLTGKRSKTAYITDDTNPFKGIQS